MKIDHYHPEHEPKRDARKVFVDGKEIHGVVFVDTDTGFIQTVHERWNGEPGKVHQGKITLEKF